MSGTFCQWKYLSKYVKPNVTCGVIMVMSRIHKGQPHFCYTSLTRRYIFSSFLTSPDPTSVFLPSLLSKRVLFPLLSCLHPCLLLSLSPSAIVSLGRLNSKAHSARSQSEDGTKQRGLAATRI